MTQNGNAVFEERAVGRCLEGHLDDLTSRFIGHREAFLNASVGSHDGQTAHNHAPEGFETQSIDKHGDDTYKDSQRH